jgi:hypothetical protein
VVCAEFAAFLILELSMKRTFWMASGLLLTGSNLTALPAPSMAAPSVCDAIAGNLVRNCGFETGDLTNWTKSGNNTSTIVLNSSTFIHSGNFGLQVGSIGSDGFISQTLTTVAGSSYTITAWYHPLGSNPADFDIEWNGATLLDVPNAPASDWLQETVTAVGTGSDIVTISFRDDTRISGIDDISVVAAPVAAPEPGSLGLLAAALMAFGLLRQRKRQA